MEVREKGRKKVREKGIEGRTNRRNKGSGGGKEVEEGRK